MIFGIFLKYSSQKLPETKGAPLLQSITELDDFYEENSRKKGSKEENISLKLSLT